MKLIGLLSIVVTVKAFAPVKLPHKSFSRTSVVTQWSLNSACPKITDTKTITRRRSFTDIIASSTSILLIDLLNNPHKVSAATAPNNNDKPKEFINVGTQAPAPSGESEFVTLSNGVKIKDFRMGTGDAIVNANSEQVMIQASGRLLNLNGVVFYNTKNNNPDGFGAIPLTINLGKGEALPGLESGIVGMRKGGIRRIIVPAELAYSKFPNLEPQPISVTDRRALDSVVKNPRRDATILFDVSVERFK